MSVEFGSVLPLRPHSKEDAPAAAPSAAEPPARAPVLPPGYDWKTEYREGLPYWQHNDPIPPPPEQGPELETPGETLNDRQEAFCRAYVELPVGIKAARLAGYAPAAARRQATRLLKHPLVIRRIYELRDVRGKDHQVRRDTIIDQAEAVFEAAMEKADYYAAMQALTMKARLAGFADYLPGVRVLRRDPRDYEQEFWSRTHAAEQRLAALRYGEFIGAEAADAAAEKQEAEWRVGLAEKAEHHHATRKTAERDRRGL
jgi:phage terminase small subunit